MMTLHEAMAVVLSKGPKTAKEIADEINRRKLYCQKDGRPVPAGQISARANKRSHLFDKEEKKYFLKVKL